MIYNGITISKEEARLLVELYSSLVQKNELFEWMHKVGLVEFFNEVKQALYDPIYEHIESYHEN